MNERPMRQMSLRAFRDSIALLTAPVEVSKRGGDGSILVLGYWTPYAQHLADAKLIEPLASEIAVAPVTLEIPFDDDEPEFPVSEDSEFDRHPLTAPRLISSPAEAASAVRVDPVRAVPKPSSRKRKRP